MNDAVDVIVVGSGASAVHAAWPLVEAGRSVSMLDVGNEDTTYAPLIPRVPFAEMRRADPAQHRYILGDQFEGIPLDKLGAGPQLTPPRQFVLQHADSLTPTATKDFEALESLALGGLGEAWGAVCFPFADRELERCRLSPPEMRGHYETVARRIGVWGASDDLLAVRGPLEALQPPPALDHNAELILKRYEQRRDWFHQSHIRVGRAFLAALSQPLGERQPNPLHDMDFWSNESGVYRPSVTVRQLRSRPNFSYRRPYLVESFSEAPDGVTVRARNVESGQTETFRCRVLILAAGALGTTRIALRSLACYDAPVPLVCNAHSYAPCVHYRGLGRAPSERCHSLAQLTMIYDPTGDGEHLVQAQFYSYRSLLLFRLLREAPLPYRESLRIMRTLAPAFVLLVIQHEDCADGDKRCVLRRKGNDDYLEIIYRPSEEETRRQRQHEQTMIRSMWKLGCCPMRTVSPGHGSSIHYGGQLPASIEDKPLTTELTGRLRGTRAVYVADGAALPYLPAKGLTFTLMANANRIAGHVLRSMSGGA